MWGSHVRRLTAVVLRWSPPHVPEAHYGVSLGGLTGNLPSEGPGRAVLEDLSCQRPSAWAPSEVSESCCRWAALSQYAPPGACLPTKGTRRRKPLPLSLFLHAPLIQLPALNGPRQLWLHTWSLALKAICYWSGWVCVISAILTQSWRDKT